VLDINLPDVDGFTLCRTIRADPDVQHVAILMVSASYLSAPDMARGLDAGADAYLVHPVDPQVLLASVRALLRMRAAEATVRTLNATLEQRIETRTRQLVEQQTELTRSNDALRLANEELEAFTYSASHDLRTPVRHITGFADLALRELSRTPNAKVERQVAIIRDAAERMNALIDAMLLLSRTSRQELRAVTVDLAALVRQAQRDADLEFPGRPVAWEVAPLPHVTGDVATLQQVMTNLISNAVKFSKNREHASVRIWAETRPDEWAVFVRDNGEGFDAAYTGKLFGVFQRLHRYEAFEGTGVGLATVRRIVARHGGQVFAESHGGQGATFGFTLPRPR
jgi:two-component system sensor histidine kinase/response regulator